MSDPSRAGLAADLITGGEGDRSGRSGRSGGSRAPLLALAWVLVVLAGLAGADALRDRRAAAAIERELASTVLLELEPGSVSASGTGDGDSAQLELTARVRNTGPRPVTLVGASFGPLVSDREARVVAGGVSARRLRLDVRCDQQPPLLDPGDALSVQVRTSDGQSRTVSLGPVELGFDPRTAQQLCGYLPPEEALTVLLEQVQVAERELDAVLVVGNAGRVPIEVRGVRAAAGLSLEVVGADGADALPVTVEPDRSSSGPSQELRLPIRIGVEDCAPLLRLLAGSAPLLFLEVGEPDSRAQLLPGELQDLVLAVCPQD